MPEIKHKDYAPGQVKKTDTPIFDEPADTEVQLDIDELVKSLEEGDDRVLVEDAPKALPLEGDFLRADNVAPEVVITEVKTPLRKPTPQTLREMKRGRESLQERYGPIVDGPIDID